jgi:CubicO group peptidase (beta-lactamase class C family)
MTDLQDAFDRIDQLISRKMQAVGLPGMAVAVTDRSRLLRAATFGFSDIGAKIRVTPEHLFEIGSIGKSFTSILLLQQRETGRLDLHTPVSRYLRWFEVKSKYQPITLHHLMCHTAGIVRGSDIAPHGLYEVFALRNLETGFPPGAFHYYSDVGYKVLGTLLEELLDQPYSAILQSRILEPLGMSRTHAVMTFETRKHMAMGYHHFFDDRPARSDPDLLPAPWHEYGTGDGSPASTAGDMAIYLRMLLNCGQGARQRILSGESFNLMIQRLSLMSRGAYYGYGLVIEEIEGHMCIAHAGQTLGYSSVIVADMVDGLGVVILTNGPAGALGAFNIAWPVLKILRAGYYRQKLPPLPPVSDPTRIENALDYVGTYRMGPKSLTFVNADNQLFLHYGNKMIVLEQRGVDRFYADHADFALFLLHFQRDPDNRVAEVFYGSDWYTHARYHGSKIFEFPKIWEAYRGHYRSHNPWSSNFRVVLRKGVLSIAWPSGDTYPLVPLIDKVFRVGADAHSPERIYFGSVVKGKALRANLSGCDYYRTFTA